MIKHMFIVLFLMAMYQLMACSQDDGVPPAIDIPQSVITDNADDTNQNDDLDDATPSPEPSATNNTTPSPEPIVSPTPSPIPTINLPDDDGDGYENDSDCDDADSSIHPNADEQCNGIDDNCDGQIDEESPFIKYVNQDLSIQSAIDRIENDGCIFVSAGGYHEDINFHGKAIWIQATDGVYYTSITGSENMNVDSVVTFDSGETNDSILNGFQISSNNKKRGIKIINSSPTIENNQITSNQSAGNGVGIYIEANAGTAAPVIQNNGVSNNTCIETYCEGIGIYVFVTNQGIGSPIIKNNIISNNINLYNNLYSSGVYLNFNGSGKTTLDNNSINNQPGNSIGLHYQASSANTETIIRNNFLQNNSAGLYIMNHSPQTTLQIYNNRFEKNTSAGIFLYMDKTLYGNIQNNIILNNNLGIMVSLFDQIGELTNSFNIKNNTISNNNTGMQFVSNFNESISNLNMIIENNIISFSKNYGIDTLTNTTSSVTLSHLKYNDIYSNVENSKQCSDSTVCTTSSNYNKSKDPAFVVTYDGISYNFHLKTSGPKSPCIDTGNPDTADYDVNGTLNDMGTYGGPYGNW